MAPETTLTPTPTTDATPGAPAPVAPAAPSLEERRAAAREYLKETHGIEDPDAELPALRQRARQADELERVVRTVQRPPIPEPQPTGPPSLTREEYAEIEQLGRINPVAAYARLNALNEAQREYRDNQRSRQQAAQTVAYVSASQAYTASESEAERYCKTEYPEIYDQRTSLYREGQRVYDSMPELRGRGDGFKIAAQIAASNLALLPKSKRSQVSDAARDADDQAPERGSRRPARDGDDLPVLTAKQRKLASEMQIEPKEYQKRLADRQAARKERA